MIHVPKVGLQILKEEYTNIQFQVDRMYIAACKELAHFISHLIPVKKAEDKPGGARLELGL